MFFPTNTVCIGNLVPTNTVCIGIRTPQIQCVLGVWSPQIRCVLEFGPHKYSVYWEFGPHKYGVYWNSDPTSTVCVGNLVPTSDQAPPISSWLYFLTILRTNNYFIDSIVSASQQSCIWTKSDRNCFNPLQVRWVFGFRSPSAETDVIFI